LNFSRLIKTKKPVTESIEEEKKAEVLEEAESVQSEGKVSLGDKIREMFIKMFEVEDQNITSNKN
jgi:hypothetical protein